jgi:hypothetical protein
MRRAGKAPAAFAGVAAIFATLIRYRKFDCMLLPEVSKMRLPQ